MTEEPATVVRLFCYALIAVGALITLLSGACTGYFVLMNIASLFLPHHQFNRELMAISFTVGAPFIFIGVVLVILGRRFLSGNDL